MMMMGDERLYRFARVVERMQACELIDTDYRVSRMTDDYGIVSFEVEIPDKDITSLLKRPSVLRLEQPITALLPKAKDESTKVWTDIVRKMRKLSAAEGE